MALEDSVAKYEIQITRSGDGAVQAVQDFKNLDAASKNVAVSVGASSESLKTLRNTSLLARQGMNELTTATVLLGGSAFPELSRGVLAARLGLTSMRTAAILTGSSLAAVGVALAGVAAAAAIGVTWWQKHTAELQAAKAQQDLLTQSTEIYADVLKKIQQYQAMGIMTEGQAQKIRMGTATGKEPIPGTVGSFWGMDATTYPLANSLQLRSGGDAARMMNELGFSGDSVDALQKFKTLQRQLYEETLSQYDKERAKADDLYQEKVKQISDLAYRSKLISKEDRSKAVDTAYAGLNLQMSGIQAKETAEIDKRDADAKEQLHKIVVENQRQADEELKAAQAVRQEESLAMIRQFNQEEKLYTLTSKQDKKAILDQELQDRLEFDANMMLDYRVTLDQMAEMDRDAHIKYQEGLKSIEQKESIHTMTVAQMEIRAAEQFASGFTDAFASFIQGTKSAEQAFSEFAASFIAEVGKMILQQEILNLIRGALYPTAPVYMDLGAGAANGGLFPTMAASGLSGVSSVSSPTYFPKFNVVAGEAGREMLTVLARPRMMDIGGMQAVVGKAGNNTLAITNASDLANKSGPNGTITVELRPAPGYEASIVQSAVQGAVVKVTSDMGQHTPLRQAVKQAIA